MVSFWGICPYNNAYFGLVLLLMEEILHQLTSSFPIIYKVLYIPGGAGVLVKELAS